MRQCAFVTYVRQDGDARDAALLMFSVRMHQAVCYTLVLVTEAVSPPKRQLLSRIGTLVEVAALPHGHDPRGFDILRLWQLTAFKKIVYLPSNLLALRNLTALTQLPEWTVQLGALFNHFDLPVMILKPSELTFVKMRDAQHRTARTSTIMRFLTNFFDPDKIAIQRARQHHQGHQLRVIRRSSPASSLAHLQVGLVIHQQDFMAWTANGTDIFDKRPLAIQYLNSNRVRAGEHEQYAEFVCSWNAREQFRHDPLFLRYVYEALMQQFVRHHAVKSFTYYDENTTPLKLMVPEEDANVETRFVDVGGSSDLAATATIRPTFRFMGSANLTVLFPSERDLKMMTAQQRRSISEYRSKFLAAVASDIEAWHSIDPGLVIVTDLELTAHGALDIFCEIRVAVDTTKLRPDELRKAISSTQGNLWLSRTITVYRQVTNNQDAQIEWVGVRWNRHTGK